MPVPTIKDLFTPINSIGTCLESKAAIISKNLVDINNSITGAATALGEKSKSIKDSIDDAKKDIIKSLKDLRNTNVGKTKQGTNLKSIEKLSKEFSSNLASGITSISGTFAKTMETNASSLYKINSSIEKSTQILANSFVESTNAIRETNSSIEKSTQILANSFVESTNAIRETNSSIEKLTQILANSFVESANVIREIESTIKERNKVTDDTLNDFKKGVLKHIGDSSKKKIEEEDISQRKMKNFSKELKDGIVSGIGIVATSVQQASGTIAGAVSELGMGIAQTNQILMEINKGLVKTNFQLKTEKRREKREDKKRLKNLSTGKQTLNVANIKGGDDVGKSVESIARAVRVVGEVKLKDVLLFKTKLKKMIRGIIEPVKDYNENFKPGEGVLIAKDIEELGHSLASFVKDMSKTTAKGAIASKFVGKDMKKSPVNKLLGAATYAVLTNVYGATYNRKTGKYSKFDKKQAVMLSTAGVILNKLGTAILKFNAKMALSAVLAPVALLGAALFRLEVPLIKSAINALMGKGAYNKKKKLKYIAAGIILDKIGTSVLMFNAKMALAAVLAPVAAVGIGLFALLMVETSMVFSLLANRKTKAKFRSGARTLNMITGSIIGFEAYMVLSILLAPVAMVGLALATPIMLGANAIFKRIGKKSNKKKVVDGSIAVTVMGLSIIAFSLAMLVTTMITKRIITGGGDKVDPTNLIALAAVVPIFGLMIGGHYLMKKIGTARSVKESFNGFVAITLMSAGLIVFSIGMLVANSITKNMWKTSDGKFDPIAMITSVGVFGLMFVGSKMFQIAGNHVGDIAKGLASVALMALGIGLFGFGLSFYAKTTKDLTTKDLIEMPLILAGFAIEFGIMGAAVEFIALGGAAAAAMGVGVGVFGIGLKEYSDNIKDLSKDDTIRMAKLIGLYGVEFAGIGLMSPSILAADVAFAVMGGALAAFGKGHSIYVESIEGSNEKQLKIARENIGKLGVEFAGIGLMSPSILAADVAIATMGGGLAALGKGMKIWKDAGGVSDEELLNLCKTVDYVKLAFMGSVDENGKPKKIGGLKGLLNSISGTIAAPFNLATVIETATSLTVASDSIIEIAKSLKFWEEANVNIDSVTNLTTVIAAMNEAFGKMAGRSEKSEKGLLGKLIGIDFSVFTPTDVELGIRSTKDMGKALKNIAEGVVAFRDGIGKEFTDKTKAEELGVAITNVITPIANGFAALEGLEPYENPRKKGLLGNLITSFIGELGSPAGKTKIATGIKSVKNLGKTLKDLAEGVKEFATLIPKNAQASWLKDVGDNIAAVLTALQGPLVALGTSESELTSMVSQTESIGSSMNDVYASMGNVAKIAMKKSSAKDGVEAIRGLGETLVGIANATKTFSEMSLKQIGTSGTWNENWEITSPGEGALGAMTAVLCGQFALFNKFGVTVKETGTYEETKKEGNIFNRKEETTTKSYIGLAINSISNLGSIVSDIGDALKKFSSNEWKDGAINGASDAFRTILAFSEAFGTLGYVMTNGTTYTEQYRAISSKGWKPDIVSKFGTISGSVGALFRYSDNLIKGSNTVKSVVTSYTDVFAKANSNMETLKKFYDNPEYMMYPIYNFLEMTRILASNNEEEVHLIHKSGKQQTIGNLKLTSQTFDNAITNTNKLKEIAINISTAISKMPRQELNAKSTSDMKVAINNLSEGFKEIENIKPISVTSFDNVISSISKSLNVLDGKGRTLDKTTKLVNSLIVAKKNNVFGDLSKNTQNIANAINSLAKDNLQPYSELIAALGKMSDRDSKYKELFNDIIELLKKMNAELAKENSNNNENGGSGGNGGNSGSASNNNKTNVKKNETQNKPQQPVRTHDYTTSLNEIKSAINSVKLAIDNKQF